MSLTPQQTQLFETVKALAAGLLPMTSPGISLAITLALNALQAVKTAQNAGQDVSPEQLAALFAADDLAKQDDLKAQQEALQKRGATP